ncbi:winged helix-turn-helix domain-containing protein [Shewanella baltica]|uniref:winged helix-turn-helix domain-containing protein n=1 Tax=Shewanella baltica TaxID=62322 RepID=UPI002877B626|nr:helix-turn-helix domain-containing protein [Shewanella baltica]MCS6177135.1 helix-turn-helix domain-containing protein [Shewanella baltica]MCS6253344.1 helix-turn-helix domain-containing protein [Shewanella baltica]
MCMQLGDCRFDRGRGMLIELSRDESWHLSRAELQVLTLLLEHQGQLVSKHMLKTGDGQGPPLTDASVSRAISTLRSFLGPQHEGLIETVKGQGYLLRPSNGSEYRGVNYLRLHTVPLWSALVLFGVMLAFSVFYLKHTDHSKPTQALMTSILSLASGQQVRLNLYADSSASNTLLFEMGERLSAGLIACGKSDWADVYASLSHDKQVLNMTFRGEKLDQSVLRNISISDFSRPKAFIDSAWLREVDICG